MGRDQGGGWHKCGHDSQQYAATADAKGSGDERSRKTGDNKNGKDNLGHSVGQQYGGIIRGLLLSGWAVALAQPRWRDAHAR